MSWFSETGRTFSRCSILFGLLAALSLASPVPSARAVITPEGDVLPSDLPPASWTSFTDAYIGKTGSGTLTVDGDSDLLSKNGYIGYGSTATGVVNVAGTGSTWTSSSTLNVGNYGSGSLSITGGGSVSNAAGYVGYDSDSSGTVTVDGAGSTWSNSGGLVIGYGGTGTLSIANGGSVSVGGRTWVGGQYAGSSGSINFGENGGTLTTKTLYASPSQLRGAGTINTRGLVGDIDLVFDSTHGLRQTLTYGPNVTINLDMDASTGADGVLGAGYQGVGSLTIRDGSKVECYGGCVGYSGGSMGLATVTGTGSMWSTQYLRVDSGTLSITQGGQVHGQFDAYIGSVMGSSGLVTVNAAGSLSIHDPLAIGAGGTGTLSVAGGGTVSSYGGSIGSGSTGVGVVTVEGIGSTWTNGGGLSVAPSGRGTLLIASGGSVNNASGFVGSESGASGTVMVNGTGSTWTNSSFLYVGGSGSGSLSITNGGSVSNTTGYIGNSFGSSGSVTVDGARSTWTNSGTLYVGGSGSGSLSITQGGSVNSTFGYIGFDYYSSGAVTVDGAGSTWANTRDLRVGYAGEAALSITGQGAVTARRFFVDSESLLTIDVGRGSSLTVAGGTGTISNSGTFRLLAAASVAAGTYTPVSSGDWSGTGVYQAVGGILDTGTHVFTASSATAGTSGLAVNIDRVAVQRVLVSDNGIGGTGWAVGASFLGATSSSTMTFTATAIGDEVLDALKSLAGDDEAVLSGWTFLTTGYADSVSGSAEVPSGCIEIPKYPIYLSLKVGAEWAAEDLELWGYSNGSWASFAPSDLTYDGTYASFTAAGLSGYAVTAVAVPEPGTVGLLVAGVVAMLAYGRRRRA